MIAASSVNPTYTRGDVVLCDLNPVVGTEQAGIRPFALLQIDRAKALSPHTIIAPFTTKIRRALLPSNELITEAQRALRKEAQSKMRKN
jgi:mRNA interferase MazF